MFQTLNGFESSTIRILWAAAALLGKKLFSFRTLGLVSASVFFFREASANEMFTIGCARPRRLIQNRRIEQGLARCARP